MQLLFVHGWSITNTKTYGDLPKVIQNAAADYGLDLEIRHVFLGKYISFHDEVNLDDISRALDKALRDLPGNDENTIKPFSCITHSTGGPVLRYWINAYYGADKLSNLPLVHLIMLAPANHGSALAKLGKARIGRIKAWFSGVEPGQRVLDWLCLGSDGQWNLNNDYMEYSYQDSGFFPYVLTGQGIDHKFYDFLNNYLIEEGSDGVIRVAGANMNYQHFKLVQSTHPSDILRKRPLTYKLLSDGKTRRSEKMAMGIYDQYSHVGKEMGIMESVKIGDANAPIVVDILKCLQVNNSDAYQARAQQLAEMSARNQKDGCKYSMLVISVMDDKGAQIAKDDYDFFLLAGNKYERHMLPRGFLVDRQMNDATSRLIYYLHADEMNLIKDSKFGIRVDARPSKGFSYYNVAEFHSEGMELSELISPNQTTYLEIILHRFVDQNVFRFSPATDKPESFGGTKPSGKYLED